MSLDEGIADLVGKIYQGAHDPAIWNEALDGLIHYTDSRFVMVSAVDLDSGKYSSSNFYGADDARFLDGVRDYKDYKYQTDPTLSFGKRHPDAGFVSMPMAIAGSGTDYSDNPYAMWTRDILGVGASIVCYTKPLDNLIIGVSLHPPAWRGAHSDQDIRLFRMLFEHMKQSMHLSARPVDLNSATEAVLMLDSTGMIYACSDAAEQRFAQCDGMRIRNRRLCIEDNSEASRFGKLLRSALGATSMGGIGGGMRISRPSGQPPWIMKISPLPRIGESRPAATVQILCADTPCKDTDTALMAQLFGLTPTEATVATYLQRGLADAAIANHMNVRLSTIRSHVKAILAKADVRTKAELAHLLTMI